MRNALVAASPTHNRRLAYHYSFVGPTPITLILLVTTYRKISKAYQAMELENSLASAPHCPNVAVRHIKSTLPNGLYRATLDYILY